MALGFPHETQYQSLALSLTYKKDGATINKHSLSLSLSSELVPWFLLREVWNNYARVSSYILHQGLSTIILVFSHKEKEVEINIKLDLSLIVIFQGLCLIEDDAPCVLLTPYNMKQVGTRVLHLYSMTRAWCQPQGLIFGYQHVDVRV